MVGVAGIEPTASCTRNKRDTDSLHPVVIPPYHKSVDEAITL